MNKPRTHTIYTIGHSTRSLADFLDMLQSFGIKILADIRSLPGSRKFPQFDKENLKISLEEAGIQYIHLADLGGRRKVKKILKITDGTMTLSEAMPIIWKPKNLKVPSTTRNISL